MIIVTIALWFITIILIVTNRDKIALWASSIAFLCGLGGFAVILEENIFPFLESSYDISENGSLIFKILVTVSSGLAHYLIPWCALMFGVVSSGILSKKGERIVAFISLIPVILTFFFFPTHNYFILDDIEELTKYFQVLVLWCAPYIALCNVLLLFAYLREKNTIHKKNRLITCLFVIPFFTCAMFTNYIFPAFNVHQAWRYNVVVVIVQFICFIYFAYKYSLLGIRLKFEKERLDSTMKAMTSGTAILNHSIKNEVFKISLCMKNIKNAVHKPNIDVDDINENIQTVLNSTEHLAVMMQRIREQMNESVLAETNVDVTEIINRSLEMQKHFLKEKGIKIIKNYTPGFIINCDQVHITEVFNNIIKNSAESITKNGQLEISVFSRKELIVEVKDNGCGISNENLKYVFDPFFTTKQLTMNFGLGLSYAYNVMQQHKGRMEIKSTENIGTSVSLFFPRYKQL